MPRDRARRAGRRAVLARRRRRPHRPWRPSVAERRSRFVAGNGSASSVNRSPPAVTAAPRARRGWAPAPMRTGPARVRRRRPPGGADRGSASIRPGGRRRRDRRGRGGPAAVGCRRRWWGEVDLDGGRARRDLDVGAFPAVGEHDPPVRARARRTRPSRCRRWRGSSAPLRRGADRVWRRRPSTARTAPGRSATRTAPRRRVDLELLDDELHDAVRFVAASARVDGVDFGGGPQPLQRRRPRTRRGTRRSRRPVAGRPGRGGGCASTRTVTRPASRSSLRCWLAADFDSPAASASSVAGRSSSHTSRSIVRRPGGRSLAAPRRTGPVTADGPSPPATDPAPRRPTAPRPRARRCPRPVHARACRAGTSRCTLDQLGVELAVLAGRGGQVPGVDQGVHEGAGGRVCHRPLEAERRPAPPLQDSRACECIEHLRHTRSVVRDRRRSGSPGRSLARRAEQVVRGSDHVLDELLDRPLRARGRAVQLLGPHTAQHLRGPGCGPFEERQGLCLVKHDAIKQMANQGVKRADAFLQYAERECCAAWSRTSSRSG